ncbi:hypothetical protein [Maribacter sp. 2304DJ31-5]|uniref:hypothetical protein n=1 Tax=Maribacter sp. 2304DJ31-5 TaxID=3386273 RepID=UPI0039BD825A
MALKIVWTPRAEKGLDTTISYLEEKWAVREIHNLERNLKDLLERIGNTRKSVRLRENIKTSTKAWWTRTTISSTGSNPERVSSNSSTLRVQGKNLLNK